MASPETQPDTQPRYYFQSLNILRVVAISLVYLSHIRDMSSLPLGIPIWVQGIGLELFYYVSGIVIGITVFQTPRWSVTTFLFRRGRRLLPAYYVSILLIVGLINSDFLLAPPGLCIILQHRLMHQTFAEE